MAFPKRKGKYRIVYNKDELHEAIKVNNTRKNVFLSVYSFRGLEVADYGQLRPKYDTANITLLYFDIDTTDIEKIRYAHKYLSGQDIQHTIIFSGRGFYFFIYCEFRRHIFPYDVVENAQRYFAKKMKLTIGDSNNRYKDKPILDEDGKPVIFDIDETCIGDLARVCGVLHTLNIKHKRWRIPLYRADLKLSYEEIKEMSNTRCRLGNAPKIYGKKKVDLTEFDHEAPKKKKEYKDDIPIFEHLDHIGVEGFPPCIENMIVKRSGCYAWYWAIVWFRDKGYSKKETDIILRKYLSKYKRSDGTKNDYLHCTKSDNHLDNVYDDIEGKHWFPSAQHLFSKGYCPGKCKNYKKENCIYFNGETGDYL